MWCKLVQTVTTSCPQEIVPSGCRQAPNACQAAVMWTSYLVAKKCAKLPKPNPISKSFMPPKPKINKKVRQAPSSTSLRSIKIWLKAMPYTTGSLLHDFQEPRGVQLQYQLSTNTTHYSQPGAYRLCLASRPTSSQWAPSWPAGRHLRSCPAGRSSPRNTSGFISTVSDAGMALLRVCRLKRHHELGARRRFGACPLLGKLKHPSSACNDRYTK